MMTPSIALGKARLHNTAATEESTPPLIPTTTPLPPACETVSLIHEVSFRASSSIEDFITLAASITLPEAIHQRMTRENNFVAKRAETEINGKLECI
jgi:hypothetical protein